MYPLTQRAIDSMIRGTVQTARVDVLHDGQPVKRIGSVPIADADLGDFVPSIAGVVNNSRQAIRRDGDVTFLDLGSADLVPSDVDDLFIPLIGEIRPWVGIQYWDATYTEIMNDEHIEWVPIATLVIDEIPPSASWPEVQVSGLDRLSFMTEFVGNYGITNGTPLHYAISNLLRTKIPASHLKINLPDTDLTTGALLYEEQTSSLEKLHDLALAAGWTLWVDPMGEVRAGSEPTIDDPPVMTYEVGPRSLLMRPQVGISAKDIVNVYVVTGEGPDSSVVRGVARDTNPRSVTYVDRVGERPRFLSSPLMRSFTQCELAAKTSLARVIGLAKDVAVPIIPNPALEVGDVIWVNDGDQINFPLIVDGFPTYLRTSDGDQLLKTRSLVVR